MNVPVAVNVKEALLVFVCRCCSCLQYLPHHECGSALPGGAVCSCQRVLPDQTQRHPQRGNLLRLRRFVNHLFIRNNRFKRLYLGLTVGRYKIWQFQMLELWCCFNSFCDHPVPCWSSSKAHRHVHKSNNKSIHVRTSINSHSHSCSLSHKTLTVPS